MHCTIQLNSLSGSFASPSGTDVIRCATISDARAELDDWADEHSRFGADRSDAHALVWVGHHVDITDLYPDWELTIGPRGGIRRSRC